ncbi:hypothetical protein GL50803_0017011 [Giardia duodenalis]|uniref:Uncharacterized protein n=1 Tax=Giardia intestinalis (strain ATCC 50803 / WB clone C6) TaxID=184922 RepID=A8BRL4_GIAIC|nr:hypothetical protein GL50803_0017011 [Giardia intestinalis]KAE8305984.1 hypothetical protein GL50803_0017011 [Giardia intestinalis]|eukprot:XP_001705294.1 Hypothetical protein GL50803_17011 [Giardia lamblia ATCC 50803]
MDIIGSREIGDFDLDEVEDSIRKCEAFLANEDFTLDFSHLPIEASLPGTEQQPVLSAPTYSVTTDDGVGLLNKRMDANASLSVSKSEKSYKEDDGVRLDSQPVLEIFQKSRSESKRNAPSKPLMLPKSASSGSIPDRQAVPIEENPLVKRTINLLPRKRGQDRPSVSSYHEPTVKVGSESNSITAEEAPKPATTDPRRGSDAKEMRSSVDKEGSTALIKNTALAAPRKPASPTQNRLAANRSPHSQQPGAAAQRSNTPKHRPPKLSRPGTPDRIPRSSSSGIPRAASARSKMAASIAESRLEAYLREKEERELKECTFHPKILTKKHPKKDSEREAPEDRLRNEGERKRIEHEKMRVYKERAEFEVCTFKPELSARTEKIMAKKNMKPIYERYAETMEQHRQKVEELAALAEAEQYYPEIDEKARMRRDILAQKALTRSGIDPFAPPEERLYSPGAKRANLRVAKDSTPQDANEAIECSFKPQINKESMAIARKNSQLSGDFFQRQTYYKDKKMRHIQAMERDEASALTFQPNIRRASSAGTGGKRRESDGSPTFPCAPSRVSEDIDGVSVHERLYRRSISRSKGTVHQPEPQGVHDECRFIPEINQHSKNIGRKSTIEELYRNTLASNKKDALCKVIDEEQQKECTFKPTIHSDKAKSHYNIHRPESLLVQIEMERQQKAVKLNMMKKKLEYDEVQTCSFRPEIKSTVPRTVYNGPTVTQDVDEAFGSSIKGLGRFMEKQELARKKVEEQKLRESKVFGLNPSGKTGKPYTIPQPFNLSYEMSARKSAFERDKIASVALKDYTFQPQTSEKRVKDLVAHILSNDE